MYQNPDAGIKAIKSIGSSPDNIRQQLIIRSLLSESYLLKGNYDEALKAVMENISAKVDLSKNDQLFNNVGMIMQLQNLALYEQSDSLISNILKAEQHLLNAKENKIVTAILYQLKAKNLLRNNKPNEAKAFLKKSNNLCREDDVTSYNILANNILTESRIALQKHDYKNLDESVNQLQRILTKYPHNVYLASHLDKLKANIFFDQQKYEQAINQLDSALAKINHLDFLGLKNSLYEDLAKNHLPLRHTSEHELYQKLHQESQNKIDESRKDAIENLMQLNLDFQNQNFRTIEHKNFTKLYTSLAIGTGLLIIVGFWLFQSYQKNQFLTTQTKFLDYQTKLFEIQKQQSSSLQIIKDEALEKIEEQNLANEDLEKTVKQKSFAISKEKEDEILRKLASFETSKSFMDRNMSLAALATQLEVNTKYLSEVIKKSKGKNFTTYINELKINHIAYLISTETAYRQYKISYLAELAGFASHSTFSIVFKNVTGVTPNDYIQQISKRKLI